jgi:membrane protease YdiL (CAAX protease family)
MESAARLGRHSQSQYTRLRISMSASAEKDVETIASRYWHESTRPLTSLLFIAPMLLFYEIGVLCLGPQAIRNAADVWLRQLLDTIGFGQYFLLPVLACGALVAWHHTLHQPWRFSWAVLYGMLFESLVFGFLLVVIAGWQSRLMTASISACSANGGGASSPLATMVAYVGAGIYEEVLFRLMLLPAAWGLMRVFGFSNRTSIVSAVIVTSLIFSAAHYQIDLIIASHRVTTTFGEKFSLSSFIFRFLAGVAFSSLFLLRGFGVTVGSHAMYDLFTLLV